MGTRRAPTDPPVLLLRAERSAAAVTITITPERLTLMKEIADARSSTTDVLDGTGAGGLMSMRIKIGGDHTTLQALARAVDLFAQVVGPCVLGRETSPDYVDADTRGRTSLAELVERTFETLAAELGLLHRPILL